MSMQGGRKKQQERCCRLPSPEACANPKQHTPGTLHPLPDSQRISGRDQQPELINQPHLHSNFTFSFSFFYFPPLKIISKNHITKHFPDQERIPSAPQIYVHVVRQLQYPLLSIFFLSKKTKTSIQKKKKNPDYRMEC